MITIHHAGLWGCVIQIVCSISLLVYDKVTIDVFYYTNPHGLESRQCMEGCLGSCNTALTDVWSSRQMSNLELNRRLLGDTVTLAASKIRRVIT